MLVLVTESDLTRGLRGTAVDLTTLRRRHKAADACGRGKVVGLLCGIGSDEKGLDCPDAGTGSSIDSWIVVAREPA